MLRASSLHDLTVVAPDGFHLSIHGRADIQHERWLRMNSQVNAPVVEDSWRPEAFALQGELALFVRTTELAPEPRGVDQLARHDVIRMSILPERRENCFRSNFSKDIRQLLSSFERVLQLTIR